MSSRARRRDKDTQYRGGGRGPGYAASSMENECRRCGRDVEDRRDWRPSRGGFICKRCVSGADDE